MPSITAIVATYNRCAYLAEAVASLQAQSRPVDQIIIRDDGSSDGTEGFAAPLAAASDGRILYLRSDNGGKSRALNTALQEARGDYIWICDDDDLALPHAAEQLARALEISGAGLAAGRHERFREDPDSGQHEMMGTGYWPDLSTGSVLRHLLEDIFFFQNATLVRRDALERVGPFREDLARSIDYEMFVRLAARYPVEMVDDVLFHQRKHDGARGPAAARHAADQSETVWLEHDRAIFRDFRPVLPLSLYEAMFDTPDPAVRRRAGLLQRGCVYARRNDWDVALADWTEAARIPGPLAATETAILIRAMAGKHGCAPAFRAPVSGQIAGLRRLGNAGPAIAAALGRGAIWRARVAMAARNPAETARIAAFIARTALMAGKQASAPAPEMRENRSLAPEAYRW